MARKRIIVGSPLTPAMLKSMNVLGDFPPPPGDFSLSGDWTHHYRILTCHGYTNDGNDNNGMLTIKRSVDKVEDVIKFDITQKIVNDEAIVNIIEAHVICVPDILSSPSSWEITSRFIASDGKPAPQLTTQQSVQISGSNMLIKTAGKTIKRKVKTPVTSDWTLFDAIQRDALFNRLMPASFTMLEGLSLIKPNQQISHPSRTSLDDTTLFRYSQTGDGILPYDYWLDERHRLVLAVTGARAYILDDNAAQAVAKHEQAQRKSYRTKISAGGK
jgi:hypothetical protein